MIPVFSSSDIEQSKNNELLLKETCYQIQKDFGMFGIQIELQEHSNINYDSLFHDIELQVQNLLMENEEKLMSILYQIDLSKKKIENRKFQNTQKTLSEIVTELIFERELKKVLTRRYFKENGI